MGERMEIVGTRKVNFKDDQTGRLVEGMSFYYTQWQDGVDGVAAGKFFVSQAALEQMAYIPEMGEEVLVSYNRYGKVSSFAKA